MEQPKGERARLSDVLNYQPEQYLKEDELSIIRSTFKGNAKLIKILRKVMVPTIGDAELPIEEVNADPFLNRDWSAMPMDEAKVLVVARQDAIKFIIGGLIKLQVMANGSEETEMERAMRRSKDSAQ